MKKTIIVLLVAAIVCSYVLPVYADPFEKLKAGVKRFINAPKQVPDNIVEEVDRVENCAGKGFAALGGMLKGFLYVAKDIVQGTYETLTCLVLNEEY